MSDTELEEEIDMVAVAQEGGRRRKFAKEVRKQQLINATLDSIAKRGFADTTLSHVSKQAGLSQGIVNLHFQNKENLLIETLKFLRDDYRQSWEKALEEAGDGPAERVAALIDIDFTPSVCDKKKLAGWFAFQGEAKARPTYRQICDDYETHYCNEFTRHIQDLIDEGGYKNIDASIVAAGMTALVEGLWLDILVTTGSTTRQSGRNIAYAFLSRFFPDHFSIPDEG